MHPPGGLIGLRIGRTCAIVSQYVWLKIFEVHGLHPVALHIPNVVFAVITHNAPMDVEQEAEGTAQFFPWIKVVFVIPTDSA